MPTLPEPDPWWKRSSFGSLMWFVGAVGIGVLYGRMPEEHDLLELLGLALTVAGYTRFRPTGPVPR